MEVEHVSNLSKRIETILKRTSNTTVYVPIEDSFCMCDNMPYSYLQLNTL